MVQNEEEKTASELRRLATRRDLAQTLGCADDEAFVLLVWAVNALKQNNMDGRAAAEKVFLFGRPADVETKEELAIYPWELETIANELLASPKSIYRSLPCHQWEVARDVVNLVRRMDDLDFVSKRDGIDVFRELHRLGIRQFEWQQGFFNIPKFYRNIFIYGQGVCADYFQSKYGISINEFTCVGFGMYASFVQRPNCTSDGDYRMFAVTPAARDKAQSILAAPLPMLRDLAVQERAGWEMLAYRPSVLRRYPCVRFGPRGWRIRSPLPELIFDRITSGLFYDVVSGDGSVRNAYGRRFEDYALGYLRAMLPAVTSDPEHLYPVAGKPIATPDILLSEGEEGVVTLVIECKATRMSLNARYSDEPMEERGYEEIVKGIFQLWRFFSHCRRGLTGRTCADNAVGMILTLDVWMVMNHGLFDELFERATAMAQKSDPLIEEEDRRPISFVSIPDFERTLTIGTAGTFLAAIRLHAEPDRRGGYLDAHHRAIVEGDEPPRAYPFTDLSTMLPWTALAQQRGVANDQGTEGK